MVNEAHKKIFLETMMDIIGAKVSYSDLNGAGIPQTLTTSSLTILIFIQFLNNVVVFNIIYSKSQCRVLWDKDSRTSAAKQNRTEQNRIE